jgi:hypothetical protein
MRSDEFARITEIRFHRTRGYGKDLCDFVHGEVLKVAQDEHHLLFERKFPGERSYIGSEVTVYEGHVFFCPRRVLTLLGAGCEKSPLSPVSTLEQVGGQMDRDGIEPCCELRPEIEGREVFPYPYEGFLNNIPRIILITQYPEGK